MTLEIILNTIPKSANEILYILGWIGIIVLYLRKKSTTSSRCLFFILLIMFSWRSFFQIQSSRYASGLIYIFTICASFFLFCLINQPKKKYKIILVAVFTGITASWMFKNYNLSQIGMNLEVISQIHDKKNDKENAMLIIDGKDAYRVKRMEKKNNLLEKYTFEKSLQDIRTYIMNYISVGSKTLFYVKLDSKEKGNIDLTPQLAQFRHILSIYAQKNKKKRIHLYEIESKAKLAAISHNDIIEDCGILQNGNLEDLDPPEESYQKMKTHVRHYELNNQYDGSVRTPTNAYFYNASEYTQFNPIYNCLNGYSISGKNSAKISTDGHHGYIIFNQQFREGTYQYSVDFSGKKGTQICIIYDIYKNEQWNVTPLAVFTIPSNGIYQIRTSFTINDLKQNDFFLVGATVKGEAYLDNFSIKKSAQ